MRTEILPANADAYVRGGKLIRNGELVAFGTETVYGLGADARNADAVRAVYEAKGRPSDNPLIVHLPSVDEIASVCHIDSETLGKLKTVMPAPLTVILKKKDTVPDCVTAGLDSVAVRVPASKEARDFLSACGVPVAAPSANTSGRPSPTTAQHVYHDLAGKIPLIIDMGASAVGVESTVIDMTHGAPRVLRLGGMTVERLREIFGEITVPAASPADPPLSPGMKYRHYAPSVPVVLLEQGDTARARQLYSQTPNAVLLGLNSVVSGFSDCATASLGESDREAAQQLFGALRALESRYSAIITWKLEENGYGRTVNNRLAKAAGGK